MRYGSERTELVASVLWEGPGRKASGPTIRARGHGRAVPVVRGHLPQRVRRGGAAESPARLDPLGVRAGLAGPARRAGRTSGSRRGRSRTWNGKPSLDEGHWRPGAVQGPRGRRRRHRLRDPRRGDPARVRPAARLFGPARPVPARAGRGPRGRGVCVGDGKVGVAMATSGPGGCNLVTALADAKMDSVPIVAITGQVPTPVVGNDAFQADITGIDAGDEAQLPREGSRTTSRRRSARRSTSRARDGRVRSWWTSKDPRERDDVALARPGRPARLPAHDEGQHAAGRRGRQTDHGVGAAGPVRGRRRDQGERHEELFDLAHDRAPPGRHDPDGSRRLPR